MPIREYEAGLRSIIAEENISENQRDLREKENKKCFPRITQINAEKKTSAEISETPRFGIEPTFSW